MLTIRLSRIGKRKQPTYRLVIMEKTKDPWSRYLELLGNYNPRSKQLNLKAERIKYWLAHGAESSATVNNLLIKAGIIQGKKRKVVKITKRRQEKLSSKKTTPAPAPAVAAMAAEEKSAEPIAAEAKVAVKAGEIEEKKSAETESTAKAEVKPEVVKEQPAAVENQPAENKPEAPPTEPTSWSCPVSWRGGVDKIFYLRYISNTWIVL